MQLNNLIPELPWLSLLLFAVIVLVITWGVAQLAAKFVRRLLRRDDVDLPASSIFINIIRVCIWLIGISILLKYCFNIDAAAVLGALGIGGIAISLGFQQTLSNLIGGLELSLGKLLAPGDFIRVAGIEGTVVDVTWRHTAIVDSFNDTHIIPNAQINAEMVTRLSPTHYIEIPVIIPQVDDVSLYAKELTDRAHAAAAQIADVQKVNLNLKGKVLGGIAGNLEVVITRKVRTEDCAVSNAVTRAIIDLLQQDEVSI